MSKFADVLSSDSDDDGIPGYEIAGLVSDENGGQIEDEIKKLEDELAALAREELAMKEAELELTLVRPMARRNSVAG